MIYNCQNVKRLLDVYSGKGYPLWIVQNKPQSSNYLKVWNSEARTRFRTEAVRDRFKTSDLKTMHDDAIPIEKIRCGTYFIENEVKADNVSSLCNEKLMTTLYCLYKEEI